MKLMIAFLFFAAAFVSCSGNENGTADTSYQKSKKSIEEIEKEKPLSFLKISDIDFHRNITGQTVIKGFIINESTLTAYKNIRLKLHYFKKGEPFRNHEEILNASFAPGSKNKFKVKFRVPEKADSVSVKIMNAVVNQ